jgi:hypothetical protein
VTSILSTVSLFAVVLLVLAAALLVTAEWHRVGSKVGSNIRPPRRRRRSKARLHVVQPDSEEFARAVERDLAALPTTDEHDANRRRGR